MPCIVNIIQKMSAKFSWGLTLNWSIWQLNVKIFSELVFYYLRNIIPGAISNWLYKIFDSFFFIFFCSFFTFHKIKSFKTLIYNIFKRFDPNFIKTVLLQKFVFDSFLEKRSIMRFWNDRKQHWMLFYNRYG